MPIEKPKPRPFNGSEYSKFIGAIDKLYITQHGALQEPLDADELTLLFVPPEYRQGLKLVYQIEENHKARGEIWLDMTPYWFSERIFDDPQTNCRVTNALVRVYFHRDFCPDGFVTPTPLFGTRQRPLKFPPTEVPKFLEERFIDNIRLLMRITAEWTMVRWAAEALQNSLRTPQQMRYVWPATYNIAQAAGLKMDLSTPSSRAGINAIPAPIVRPYLRETNDVVARSALIGVNDEYMTRYARKDILIANLSIDIEGQPTPLLFSVSGV